MRVHIEHELIDEAGVFQAKRLRRVLRAGGPADYYEITEDTLFRMARPRGG